ncbi:MAG: hypothetical protein HYV68_00330 [Candidatus Taylorbacteria bacterium]|nr:hypothetical protein [Candidatus Taylorbacteria bacterium]
MPSLMNGPVLYVTAFTCGAVSLILEIIGTRVLAFFLLDNICLVAVAAPVRLQYPEAMEP